ncbi:hypothetical protein [Phaeospirillum tilakii]|uniref:Flagellar hook-length control protein FliK n=1 Tax=Phaeospirillum tilakii TaxID=741673 RepID=A0ABW5CAI4_9PROT
MSVSSITGTAATRQTLANGQTATEPGSATFSLSLAATETGRPDGDRASSFPLMSAAMQSALIASQDSAAATSGSGFDVTATPAAGAVTAAAGIGSGTPSGSGAAVLADLDQLVGTLGSSAALTSAATGQAVPAPADVGSLVAKYRNGGSGQGTPGEGSFAGRLFRDLAQDGGTVSA